MEPTTKSINQYLKANKDTVVTRYCTKTKYICGYRKDIPFNPNQLTSFEKVQKMFADESKEFKKSKPEFYMGFEIEGCVDEKHREKLITFIQTLYPKNHVDDLIHYDGSIRPKCRGIEIVTPALPQTEALDKLYDLLDILVKLTKKGLFETNATCGFHVSISEAKTFKFPNPSVRAKFTYEFMKALDPAKWKKIFNRERNKYCWWEGAPTSIADIHKPDATTKVAIQRNVTFQKAQHWAAINTSHLDSDHTNFRRLEVRVIGGKDYHKKIDKLDDFLIDLQKAMAKAYDSI